MEFWSLMHTVDGQTHMQTLYVKWTIASVMLLVLQGLVYYIVQLKYSISPDYGLSLLRSGSYNMDPKITSMTSNCSSFFCSIKSI